MPIYEYRCGKCGHLFEELRSYRERKAPAACPKCKTGKGTISEGSYLANAAMGGAKSAPACESCCNALGCPSRR